MIIIILSKWLDSSIGLIGATLTGNTTPVRGNLGLMTIPQTPKPEPYLQIFYCLYQDTRWQEGSYHSAEIQSSYSSAPAEWAGKLLRYFFLIQLMQTLNCLELIYSKDYFNLPKIFVLRQFKMVANQTDCFRLEQRSAITFFVAEKYKLCKIYRRMCNRYGEAYFNPKILKNRLNTGLSKRASKKKKKKKTITRMEKW